MNWKERIRRLLGLSSEEEDWEDWSAEPVDSGPPLVWEELPQFSPSLTSHDVPTRPLGSLPLLDEERLLQIIEQAFKDDVTELDLSGRGITKLPPEIGQLTKLATLYLYNNRLSSLPAEIGQLTNLTTLDFSHNKLSSLPAEIGQLTSLRELRIIYNDRLSTLPPQIGQLTNLEVLVCHCMDLETLPAEIGQLTKLMKLSLKSDYLKSLPLDIRQLTNLKELEITGPDGGTTVEGWMVADPGEMISSFHILPNTIGQLANLTTLNLERSKLSSLPAEIGQLTKLTTLNLAENQLSTLPPEISQLTNLERLYLRNNPLPIPPEILSRTSEPATILAYYSRERKKPLNEAKLVLVGEGRVGKTSLVKRLVEKQFNPDEGITEGIAIKDWKVTVDEAEIRLNIWDFGGQEIMHATHQFFLTLRTLYVLVLDVQKDEAGNRLDYWLKLIESFGAGSPVIVVSNQIDQPRKLYLNQGELTKKYPHIKAFLNTSCKTGQGVKELVGEIRRLIGSLAHVRDEIPIEWLAVKSRLQGLGKDYVAYDDYERLCEANHVREAQEQRVLIRLLHDLGIVLNFQDDPRLRDTSVLNPAWVTGGVYKIINAKQIREKRGLLDIGQLDNILDRARYPKEMDWFIILMMRKFELCFDLEGHTEEKFLIPDLLPLVESKVPQHVDGLNFKFTYDFLPRSVISRFMVRMHGFISQDIYWRHGVLLVHNANRALVKALPRSKKIVISISGQRQGRLEFWTMIREQFDEIHKSIKGLNATVKIPVYKRPRCPDCRASNRVGAKFCLLCGSSIPVARHKEPTCQHCGARNRPGAHFCFGCGIALSAYVAPAATVDYRFLLNLQQKGIEQYPVPVGDDVVVVNVRQLLEGVKPVPKAVEREEIGALKKILEPLRLRVHPKRYYDVTLLLGQLYYEEMGDHTLARQALVDGHEAIEALRGMVQEAIQVRLSAESVRLYEMLVQCYLVEGNEGKAFEYAATAKGRAFVNRLAEARVDLESLTLMRPDFVSQLTLVRQKRQQIDELERQIGQEGNKHPAHPAPSVYGGAAQIGGEGVNRDELLGRQSVLLREEAELWREMAREYPALTATLSVPSLSAAQARALASELDATLVEYYRHSEVCSESGWCAFVVTPDGIRYVPLPLLEGELLPQLLSWRNKLHLRCGRNTFLLSRLDKLYQAAIAPLALKSERVVIAPFERLHLLPLSAARQANGYLADEHTLSFVPSLTALYVVNQERKRRSPPLRQGEASPPRRSSPTRPLTPTRPFTPTRPKGGKGARVLKLLSVAYPGTEKNYLPNVLDEAKAIVERLSKVATIGVLHEKEATPDNVIREASRYDMIHFSCHGRFKSDKPKESGLSLAGQTKEEGYLTVQRIMSELNLKQSRLATLAACLTGEVKLQQGEEHVGLLQAMMTAGVQTVIASLWHVDDASTRALFEAFYYREADIHSAPLAMRDASQLLRQKWHHPYYWAAFQVNGLPPLPKKSKPVKWPPDLLEHIEKDNQRRIITRGVTMNDQLIEENAEVLLETMWEFRSQILPALRQHPLSDELAQQSIEAQQLEIAKVKIAKALLMIVTDNPTLRQAFPDVGEIKLDEEQDEQTGVGKIGTDKQTRGPDEELDEQARESRPTQEQIIPVRNKVVDVGDYLDLYLRQPDQQVSSLSTASNQSRLSRFVAGFLSSH